jgi:folylpolyglutamate synthase
VLHPYNTAVDAPTKFEVFHDDVFDDVQDKKGPSGVIASGITKIGMDHESLLGDTLSQIAFEKAGIIKDNVPCVVDSTNEADVIETITEVAKTAHAPLYLVNDESKQDIHLSPLAGDYQVQNLSIALKIISIISKYFGGSITKETINQGIAGAEWPGRLQKLTIPSVNLPILLDGAHNESAAIELGKYLKSYRDDSGIIFVIAMTKSKSVENLLKHIINKSTDTVIVTNFSPPFNMPWVKSYDVEELQKQASKFAQVDPEVIKDDIDQVFHHVNEYRRKGDNRKIVVCGSLYLCGDVLRLVSG